ncbi:hypothetical protein [Lacimicrobium alkaliphilum]|uniref:Uncharacterized protein n=1 Tax=Lacimicrobium alkaliphilum TaxID=1526571 RepID=A0ABQ1RBM2_9ALTE|nr:hypothetical protein [Lacimicrobium alkaliphilum]GGD63012.1 hypothetical protein GCM10011357_17880 [Lacimicrobium alkaliphilum]
MKYYLVICFTAATLMFGLPALAMTTPKTAQDIITILNDAAKICSKDCQKTCSAEAKALAKLPGVSGHIQQFKQSATNCRSTLLNDKQGKSSPAHMNAYMSLMMVDSNIDQIIKAEQTQASTTNKANSAPSKVDTNIHDADGVLDINKVHQLYSHLPQFCDTHLNNPGDVTLRTCRDQCQQGADKVKEYSENYLHSAEKSKSATGLDIMKYKGLMASNLQQLERTLSKQGMCFYILEGHFKKGPTPDIYKAIYAAAQEVKDGKWPPKAAPSLDLDELLVEEDETLADKLKRLFAIDAPQKLTFTGAQQLFVNTPEFKAIAAEARKNGFHVAQVKQSMTKLNTLKDKLDSNQWRRKAEQFSDYGSKAELVEALTRRCDTSYLKDFNQDRLWIMPVGRHGFELNYHIPSAYLHRLCFNELTPALQADIDTMTSRESYQTWVEQHVSQAPLSGRATCRDCPPDRVMTPAQWLPAWATYAQTRADEFENQGKNAEYVANYKAVMQQEPFTQWLKQHQQEVNDAQDALKSAAMSARHQITLASPYKMEMTKTGLHGIDYVYAYMPKLVQTNKPRANDVPKVRLTSFKLHDMLACEQASSLWQAFIKDPVNVGYDHFHKTRIAISTCNDKFNYVANSRSGFDDLITASSIGGDVVQQVITKGQLQVNTRGTVYNEYIKFQGVDYLDFYGLYSVNEKLKQLAARLSSDQESAKNHFATLTADEYQQITGIDINDKQKIVQAMEDYKKQQKQQKQQALIERMGGQADKQQTIEKAKVSGSALKMERYGRCLRDGTANTYNCECLADAYVKQKAANPALDDYQIHKNTSAQCFDLTAIAKVKNKECTGRQKYGTSLKTDCECYGNTYAKLVTQSGRLTRADQKRAGSEALTACSKGFPQ